MRTGLFSTSLEEIFGSIFGPDDFLDDLQKLSGSFGVSLTFGCGEWALQFGVKRNRHYITGKTMADVKDKTREILFKYARATQLENHWLNQPSPEFEI